MSERGEPDVYEITWMSGHIETVLAHQVSWPDQGAALMRGMFSSLDVRTEEKQPRIHFHAEIDGRWTLTLSAIETDLRTVRLVTAGESIPDAAS